MCLVNGVCGCLLVLGWEECGGGSSLYVCVWGVCVLGVSCVYDLYFVILFGVKCVSELGRMCVFLWNIACAVGESIWVYLLCHISWPVFFGLCIL